jgi:hypothetical protein
MSTGDEFRQFRHPTKKDHEMTRAGRVVIEHRRVVMDQWLTLGGVGNAATAVALVRQLARGLDGWYRVGGTRIWVRNGVV